MPVLYLIRGLPGVGKSSLARRMKNCELVEADQFFMDGEEYKFDPTRVREAHEWARWEVTKHLNGGQNVVVANTFSRLWEVVHYRSLADSNTTTVVIDLFDAGLNDEELLSRCIHGVSPETMRNMRIRWEK